MTPSEMINIAYQENVEIEPMANIPTIHLLEYDLTNLNPLRITKVPLYAALSLKKANLCKIRLPTYLKEEYLSEIVVTEKENSNEYSKIPPRLFELSETLIKHAYNITNPERIRLQVQEIKELRFYKTLEGMKALDGHAFNIDNLTEWEFCEIRPFLLRTSELASRIISSKHQM